MPITDEQLDQIAAEPQSASVDGQSATSHPLSELRALRKDQQAEQALTGPNPNGGPKSAWGRLRPARAVMPEAPA